MAPQSVRDRTMNMFNRNSKWLNLKVLPDELKDALKESEAADSKERDVIRLEQFFKSFNGNWTADMIKETFEQLRWRKPLAGKKNGPLSLSALKHLVDKGIPAKFPDAWKALDQYWIDSGTYMFQQIRKTQPGRGVVWTQVRPYVRSFANLDDFDVLIAEDDDYTTHMDVFMRVVERNSFGMAFWGHEIKEIGEQWFDTWVAKKFQELDDTVAADVSADAVAEKVDDCMSKSRTMNLTKTVDKNAVPRLSVKTWCSPSQLSVRAIA